MLLAWSANTGFGHKLNIHPSAIITDGYNHHEKYPVVKNTCLYCFSLPNLVRSVLSWGWEHVWWLQWHVQVAQCSLDKYIRKFSASQPGSDQCLVAQRWAQIRQMQCDLRDVFLTTTFWHRRRVFPSNLLCLFCIKRGGSSENTAVECE